jgi:hypothetical protein
MSLLHVDSDILGIAAPFGGRRTTEAEYIGFEAGCMAGWLWHELRRVELPSTKLGQASALSTPPPLPPRRSKMVLTSFCD